MTSIPASAAPSDLMWGVNGHPLTAYPGVPFAQQLDLVKELGAKSYRVNISSVDSVPQLADLVALARPRGVQILPVLTPSVNLDTESSQVLYAKSFNFAVTIASRFRTEIAVWELGNELETYAILKPCDKRDDGTTYPCEWGPAGGVDPLDYAGPRWSKASAVLKGLSDGMISVDSKLLKAVGTGGWGHFGAFDRMQRDGIAWDITVWHAYREEADDVFEHLAAFKKPIWITELNHPYGSQEGVRAQANGLRTMMTALRHQKSRYNIEAAFFYELLDEPYWSDFEGKMGLVKQEKAATGVWSVAEKKPAFETIRQSINVVRRGPAPGCHQSKFDASRVTPAMQVSYVYCVMFRREADGQGLADYTKQLQEGLPVAALLKSFALHPVFLEHHYAASMADAQFVEYAYDMLLKRKPEPTEIAAYVDKVEKSESDPNRLAESLVATDEFRTVHPILFLPIRHTLAHTGTVQ